MLEGKVSQQNIAYMLSANGHSRHVLPWHSDRNGLDKCQIQVIRKSSQAEVGSSESECLAPGEVAITRKMFEPTSFDSIVMKSLNKFTEMMKRLQ